MKQNDFQYSVGRRRLFRTHSDGSITVRITRQGELSVHTYRGGG
jgi:hypothetical protein